jgi:hypothetical protein
MNNATAWIQHRNEHTAEMIAFIKSCGYRVFVRPSRSLVNSEWCFYTDGTRIAYAQWSGYRTSVSSVHKANRKTGTGFSVAERINSNTLADAIGCDCPSWSIRDARTVHKYRDWDEYHNESAFNRELTEVQS